MRTLPLRITIALPILAPLSALAQIPAAPVDLPKVIFCSGQCFAVDNKGTRIAVSKGARLGPNQRLVTGPGAYAQIKLGEAAEVGVSGDAQVAFNQSNARDRDVVVLDKGRIRLVDGDAIGKAGTRALELRTSDGVFSLRSADVEVKAGSELTAMKVNAGDASLRTGATTLNIPRDGVQGFSRGTVVNKSIDLAEIAPPRVAPPANVGTGPFGPGSALPGTASNIAGLATGTRNALEDVSGTAGGLRSQALPIVQPRATGPSRPAATSRALDRPVAGVPDRASFVNTASNAIPMVPVVELQGKVTGACPGCASAPPPTTPSVKPSTAISAGVAAIDNTSTSIIAPTTQTLNTTLSVLLAPTTTFTATISPTTTTTTTTSTSTSLTSACLSCTTLLTSTSPTTTTTTTTTTSTGTLSTTKLTSTTLTFSSTSLLLK